MTYWALNAFFLVAVAGVAVLAVLRGLRARRDAGRPGAGRPGAGGSGVSRPAVSWPAVGITAALLLAMTAVFDNIMIAAGLVGYDESLISGAFVGIAPLEDFAYTVAAVVLLPSLWALLPVSSGASARTDAAPVSPPAAPSPSGGDT